MVQKTAKVKTVYYAYMDESGEPGVKRAGSDWFLVSLILFRNKKAMEKCRRCVDEARRKLRLDEDYEFHYTRNSTRVQRGFIELMKDFSFEYVTVGIKKNEDKRFASYEKVACELVRLIPDCEKIRIKIDKNPRLLTELRKALRKRGLRYVCREDDSEHDNLLQLTDYVTAISAKSVKSGAVRTKRMYEAIQEKALAARLVE